jgi:hypothetical protein
MPEEVLIDEYVNRPAVADDTKFFADNLQVIIGLLDKINDTKISLGNATGLKEVVAGAKDAKDAIDKLRKSKEDIAKADLIAAKAAKELANAEKLQAQARKENADAALKEQQAANVEQKNKDRQATNDLGAAYKEYSKAARDASLRAKSYALTLGESHPSTIAAIKDAKEMNDTLLRVDKSVGQNGRNVGNYASAFDGLGNSFTQISRELPSLTISVQQFALAISNNLPMLADEIGKAKTEIAGLKAEGKDAPTLFQRLSGAALSFNVGLSIGIALITAYAGKIADWVGASLDASVALEQQKKKQRELNEMTKDAVDIQDKYTSTLDVDYGTQKRNFETELAYLRAKGASQVDILKKEKELADLRASTAQENYLPVEDKALEHQKKNLDEAKEAFNAYKKVLEHKSINGVRNAFGIDSYDISAEEKAKLAGLKKDFEAAAELYDHDNKVVQEYYDANRDAAVKDLELQKAIAEQRAKFFADELQYRADQKKALSETEDAPELTRLNARKDALDKEKQILKGQKDDEVKDAKGNVVKLFEIYRKYNFDRKKLVEDYEKDVAAIRASAIVRQREQEKADNEMFANDQEEKLQKEIAQVQKQSASRQMYRAQGQQLEIGALNKSYDDQLAVVGENNIKRAKLDRKYAQDRADLEYSYAVAEVNSQIQTAEEIIAKKKAANQDVTAEEEQVAKLRTQLSDTVTKHIIDNGKKEYDEWTHRLDATKDGLNTIKDLWQGATDFISGMIGAQTTAQKNAIEEQIKGIEAKSKTDIDAINASADSAEVKAAKIAVIEAKAATQKQELERKQAQLDERRAKFEKAANIGKIVIETALAVVHQLTSGDPATSLARAIAVGALGAAQLTAAIATPIPKFKDGRDSGPATLAYVGDGGRHEVVTSPDLSQAYVTPDTDTLTYLKKDWRVFPDIESYQAAAGGSAPMAVMPSAGDSNQGMVLAMAREISGLKSAIKSMPGTQWVMSKGEFRKFVIMNNQRTEYLNANF